MADAGTFWLGIVAGFMLILAGLFIHFGLGYVLDTFLYEYPSGDWEDSDFYAQSVGTGGYNETVNQMYLWGYVAYGLGIFAILQAAWRKTRSDRFRYPGSY